MKLDEIYNMSSTVWHMVETQHVVFISKLYLYIYYKH